MKTEGKKPEVVVSPVMKKFFEELAKLKPSIERLDPEERENKVLDLRKKLLPEEELKRFDLLEMEKVPEATKQLQERQKEFLERQKELEPRLITLSYSNRCTELESLKKMIMGEEL